MKMFYPILRMAVIAAVAVTLPACATGQGCPLMKKSCHTGSAQCSKANMKECPMHKSTCCTGNGTCKKKTAQ